MPGPRRALCAGPARTAGRGPLCAGPARAAVRRADHRTAGRGPLCAGPARASVRRADHRTAGSAEPGRQCAPRTIRPRKPRFGGPVARPADKRPRPRRPAVRLHARRTIVGPRGPAVVRLHAWRTRSAAVSEARRRPAACGGARPASCGGARPATQPVPRQRPRRSQTASIFPVGVSGAEVVRPGPGCRSLIHRRHGFAPGLSESTDSAADTTSRPHRAAG